jgi:predicted CoA-binding protein
MFSRTKFNGHKEIMEGFKQVSTLPRIQRAIDVVQIHIQTSKVLAFTVDYYSFKSKAYNMQLQVIIDYN